MRFTLALSLLLLATGVRAQTVVGPLQAQNNLSEIAANGMAAQAVARTNLGISGSGAIDITDGVTNVPGTTELLFSSGCTVTNSGGGIASASCGNPITWPTIHGVVISTGGNSPHGIVLANGQCLVGTAGDPISGACGGAASITIVDSFGNSVSGTSTLDFGPGFLIAPGATGTGIVNLNQPNRLVTTCSGTPSPCVITALDLGGQVTFNASTLTAVIPALTLQTPTGTATTTALTLSSGTGVSVGDLVVDAGGQYPPGTIITAITGTAATTNHPPANPISTAALTISFGSSGLGFRIMNINASNVTLASAATILGYPGGSTGTVPFDGGIDCLSTGALWYCGGIGFQPNQAFTNRDQTWSPTNTQTWGLSKVPHNPQTGTTYLLSSTDCGIPLDIANASPITVTFPGTLPLDCFVPITQTGAGQITVVTSSGATLDGPGGITKTRVQWSVISVTVNVNSGGSTAHGIVGGDGA